MTEAEPQTTYRLFHALNLCLFVRQPLAGQPIRLGTVLYCDGMRFANNSLDFLMPNHVPILESVIRCGLLSLSVSWRRLTVVKRESGEWNEFQVGQATSWLGTEQRLSTQSTANPLSHHLDGRL